MTRFFSRPVCTELRDEWCDAVQVVLRESKGDGGSLCNLDDARGDVEELSLVGDVESRHLALRGRTVAGVGKGDGAAWQAGVCVGVRRRGLESGRMGEAKGKLWASCVVEWLGVRLNERGHD